MWITVLNVVTSGLIMGGVYAIIAMGMSIQYGVARILNVSHGEFIMIGAFLTLVLVRANVNPLIAMLLIVPAMFLLGFVLHRTIYKKLGDVSGSVGAFESNSMLVSFGLMFVLQNVALQIWGSQQQVYAFLQTSVSFLGTAIALNRLVVLLLAVAISLMFYFFLQTTRLGKAIRAVSQDADAAALMGVKIHRVGAICFGIGAVLAGVAGSLISIINQFNTSIGMSYTIIAIIVVVLGGMGSVPGSLLGGFILGFVGTLVNYIDPSLSLVAYYLIIIVLLLVKPSGLMGGKT
ncbi:MAG: branched-chain amino acid ABC transporter permease [Oscillospiraceae bacterium]|jgi:branched-chain amino acid transport system permease protein|nr:branched-chain amino acid ABC transporter permease [Oscillospiraceae bacterium]